MAEQKKPRNVKDLKARLGKTMTPPTKAKTGGAPAPTPGPTRGSLPAPSVGGVKRAGATIPRPAVGGSGAAAGGAGNPFAPTPAAPSRPPDPFSAQPAAQAGPREVRLVVDESPVDDAEVGKKRRGLVFLLLGAGIAVGMVVGGAFIHMNNNNRMWNMGARSGDAVYQQVQNASSQLTKAQALVDSASTAARGGPGVAPTVDYESIEGLLALENPMTGDTFTEQNYNLFKDTTVADLFAYHENVNTLWRRFQTLNARTSGEQKRAALAQSAEGAQNIARPTGCVPDIVENRLTCGLVFVFPNPGGNEGTVRVASRANAAATRQVVKTVFVGAEGQSLSDEPNQYVVIINNERSEGVLGQQASQFAEYVALIFQIKALMDETVEIQARLENDLGQIAALNERFALFDSGGQEASD